MEQFSLEKYLENPSRKLRTREGRLVRIICIDRKAKSGNIVGLVGEDESFIYVWQNDGTHAVSGIDANDLFFADEEEELTEFENKLLAFALMFSANIEEEKVEYVKECAKTLLDLARKELFKEQEHCVIIPEEDYYEQLASQYHKGHEDSLKSLPKWKKSTLPIPDKEYPTGFNGKYFCYKGYCVNYKKLFEILPKEEEPCQTKYNT